MEYKFWKCNKCGKCCTNQKKRMDLFENELQYFPLQSYRKHVGVGKTKSNMKIVSYQLIPKRCPLYDKTIGCTIYENRPLVCRRFPYTLYGIDDSCANAPRVGTLMKVAEEDLNIVHVFNEYSLDITKQAMEEMGSKQMWILRNLKWRPFDPVKHRNKSFRNRTHG